MTCEQARELAALAASGDVTAAERRSLDLHNLDCPECRAEAEGFEDILARLGAMREETFPEAAGVAVRSRVLAQIPNRPRPGWLSAWPAFATVLACSAVLVVLLRPEPPVERPTPKSAVPVATLAPDLPEAVTPAPATPRKIHRTIPKASAEPVVVHMFTSDPDVVIYWIADSNRKSSESGAM